MTLDPFYPIVDSTAWVQRLVGAGARLFQLRIKDWPAESLRHEIREAKKISDAHRAQLVVNDDWQLAMEEGCGFVHLGQEDLQKADLAALRRAKIKLGISTHSHEELQQALAAKPDYIALGPIYPTQLKQMPWAPQGLGKISEWKKLIGALPLVVIGGITLERAQACYEAGADSVAVVTDIMRAANPEQRVADWLQTARLAA